MVGRKELEEWGEEDVQLSSGQQNTPYWQGQKRKREEWVLVPTGEEEAGRGQLVDWVQTEPWIAAAAAAHSSVRLSFLIIPLCFLLPSPNNHAAAAENLCAAAAGIEIGGVPLLVSPC